MRHIQRLENILVLIPQRSNKIPVTPEFFQIRINSVIDHVNQFTNGDFTRFNSCIQKLTYMIEDHEGSDIEVTLTDVRQLLCGNYRDIAMAQDILKMF